MVVPSRELALQCEETFRALALPLRSLCLYGGRPAMEEHRRLREVKPQLVFATPGRLLDHLDKGNIGFENVRVLVIDEFDKCLDMGFSRDVERIATSVPLPAQRIFTSATDVAERNVFRQVCPQGGGFCKLDFTENKAEDSRLHVTLVHAPQKDKLETLANVLTLAKGEPSIVFLGYRDSVQRVTDYLLKQGFPVVAYHGGMEQEVRERSLYKYKSGCCSVLVSTDLASRGLDIPETRHVIHYHLPASEEAYIHRSGRSTRWEAAGDTYILLGPEETLPEYISFHDEWGTEKLAAAGIRPVSSRWCTLYIGRGKKEKLSKTDILGFLCKKGGLTAADIGRIDVKDHHAYVAVAREKLRPLLKNTRGEKIKGMKTLIEEMRN